MLHSCLHSGRLSHSATLYLRRLNFQHRKRIQFKRFCTKPGASVSVYFKNHDILTDASPGESLLAVAHKCGVEIPTGCLTGSCGTCEIEVTRQSASGSPITSVVRSCIATVPVDVQAITVDDISDAVWGVDGMDL